MRKIVVIYVIGLILLFLLGHVMVRPEGIMRLLRDGDQTGLTTTNDFSLKEDSKFTYDFDDYKRSNIAFGAYDLFAGLTKKEIDTVGSLRFFFFVGLFACLLVLQILRKP